MVNRVPAYKKEDKVFVRKLLRAHGSNTAEIRKLMDITSMDSYHKLMAILSEISEKATELGQEKEIQKESNQVPNANDLIGVLREVLSEIKETGVSSIWDEVQHESTLNTDVWISLHARLFSNMKDFSRFQSELLRYPYPQLPSTFDGWVFFSTAPNQFLRLLGDICQSKKYGESAVIAEVISTQIIPMLQQDQLCLSREPYTIKISEDRSVTLANIYDIYKALGEGGVQLFTLILAKVDTMKIANTPKILPPTVIVPIIMAPQSGDTEDTTPIAIPDIPKENIYTYIAGKPVDHNGSEAYVPTSGKIRDIVSRLNQYFQEKNSPFTVLTTDFGTNAFGAPYLATNIEPERHSTIEEVLNRWKTEESLSVGR